MADVADLELQIGADISGVVKGLDQYEKSLYDIQESLQTLTVAQKTTYDPKQIISYGKQIQTLTNLEQERLAVIKNANSVIVPGFNGTTQALNKVAKSSSLATNSLFSLSGIVQDAPYGFRAIGNNITFFTQQMAYSAKASGGLKAALKDMGGAFLGPAGLIFGISAAVSIITALVGTEQKAKKQTDELQKAITDMRNSLKNLTDVQGDAISSSAHETAELKLLYTAATDVTRSQAERLKAAKDLQTAFPKTFSNLSQIKIISGGAADAFQKLSDNIIKVSQASVILKEVESNIQKIGDAQKGVDKALDPAKFKTLTDNYVAAQDALNKAKNTIQVTGAGAYGGANPAAGAQAAFNSARNALNDYIKTINGYRGVILGAQIDNKNLVKTFNALDFTAKPPPGGGGKAVKGDSQDILVRRAAFNVNRVINSTRDEFRQFTQDSSNAISTTLVPAIGLVTKNMTSIEPVVDVVNLKFVTMADTLSNDMTGAFESVFSAIANGGNPFDALIQAVEQLIIKLAAAAAVAAILSTFTGGAGAGVTKLFGGGGFGNIFGKLSGLPFASGGIVSGPTQALIGEYAGARSNPEVVAPLSKLKTMLAGAGGGKVNIPSQIRLVANGRDLVSVINTHSTSVKRRNG